MEKDEMNMLPNFDEMDSDLEDNEDDDVVEVNVHQRYKSLPTYFILTKKTEKPNPKKTNKTWEEWLLQEANENQAMKTYASWMYEPVTLLM